MLKSLNTIDRNDDVFVTKSQDYVDLSNELKNIFELFTSTPRVLELYERGERDSIESNPAEHTDDASFNFLQRNVLLALAQQPFEHSNYNHKLILENLRNMFAFHMPPTILEELGNQEIQKYLQAHSQSIEYTDFLFEKDVTEAIGFSDGNDPTQDTLSCGMLGILTTMNFLQRLETIQKDALSKSQDPFDMLGTSDPEALN